MSWTFDQSRLKISSFCIKPNIQTFSLHNLLPYFDKPFKTNKNSPRKCLFVTFKSSNKNISNLKRKNKISGTLHTINQFINLLKRTAYPNEDKNNQILSSILIIKRPNPFHENSKTTSKVKSQITIIKDQTAPNLPARFQCLQTVKTENTWNAQQHHCLQAKKILLKDHLRHLSY
jgi:hypothetical protein